MQLPGIGAPFLQPLCLDSSFTRDHVELFCYIDNPGLEVRKRSTPGLPPFCALRSAMLVKNVRTRNRDRNEKLEELRGLDAPALGPSLLDESVQCDDAKR